MANTIIEKITYKIYFFDCTKVKGCNINADRKETGVINNYFDNIGSILASALMTHTTVMVKKNKMVKLLLVPNIQQYFRF